MQLEKKNNTENKKIDNKKNLKNDPGFTNYQTTNLNPTIPRFAIIDLISLDIFYLQFLHWLYLWFCFWQFFLVLSSYFLVFFFFFAFLHFFFCVFYFVMFINIKIFMLIPIILSSSFFYFKGLSFVILE